MTSYVHPQIMLLSSES